MAETVMLEKGDRKTDYQPYNIILDYKKRLPAPMQNLWIGKKMVVDGDSITQDASGKNYWQFVASKILGMWLDTSISQGIPANGWRGIGGSTIANEVQAIINAGQATPENAGDPKNVGLVCRYMDLPADADLVVIAGGSNDWAHSMIEMGETNSTDDTTFNGALNILLAGLKNKYPTIPVVMMTPIKRGQVHNAPNLKGLTLQQFVDAMIAKCREYGVYCLDMWGTCPINPQIPAMLELLFRTDDDTHPNEAGHEVMGKTVAGFIRALT
jgi:lysophospholipase L1-like esterase